METLDAANIDAPRLLGEVEPPAVPQAQQEGTNILPGGEEAQLAAANLSGETGDEGLELGDRILIVGGRFDKTRGRIYYIDDELIRILADGVSDRLVDIPIVDGAIEESLGMNDIVLLKKRANPAFVVQNDIRVGQKAETFTASGDPETEYTIVEVNEERDTAKLLDETGNTEDIEFGFRGIPRDERFAVIRTQEAPKEVKEEEVAAPGVPLPQVAEEAEEFEILEEIEVPMFAEIKEIPTYERVYSNLVQKNDMLSDLIKGLNPAQQKNMRRIRDLRRIVENMAQLRDDITVFTQTGKATGVKKVVFDTLAELLEHTQFPLAKQVLAVARSLYLDHTEEELTVSAAGQGADVTDYPNAAIDINYLQDAISSGIEYLENQMGVASQPETIGIQTSKPPPRWHTVWQGFFNQYFKVAPSNTTGDKESAKADRDFFRAEIPAVDLPSEDVKAIQTLPGLPRVGGDKKIPITADFIDTVSFSYLRSLGPRFARFGERKGQKIVEQADEAEIYAYILFPLLFVRDLGAIRSGVLALDVANGASKPKTMHTILEEGKGVSDIPTSQGILAVRFDGSSLGNIEVADWLKGQTIYGGGMGDILPFLRSFGMSSAELSPDQKAVISQKVQTYTAHLKKFIKDMRAKVANDLENPTKVVNESLLPKESEADLFKYLEGEPILQTALADFVERYPSYTENDVARFAALFVQYADLVLSVLGGSAEGVAIERRRVVRDQFLKALREALALKQKIEAAGEAPQPNPCPHVESLGEIRKVKSDDDRMRLMVKFLNQFRGEKKDHWIWCSVCSQHLLCEHEFLMIQEYLRPREKDVLHKELLLTFSGGDFHGKYMCKQCGQPISSLEFETSLEYDDEGRPMMGRSELVDKDALAEEEIRVILSVEKEEEQKVEFDSKDKNLIYKTIMILANLLGISPDRTAYTKMVNRVQIFLGTKPSQAEWAAFQTTLPPKQRKSYEQIINQFLIVGCAAALLVDVQTHIPEYVIRYTIQGCSRPEFIGYPRDTDSKTDYLVGINYVSCAVSSVNLAEDPWTAAGFKFISKDEDRLKVITQFVERATKEFAAMADVQQDITTKKQYLIETFGSAATFGRPKDVIPDGFTPAQIVVSKAQISAAEAPVIEAAASPAEKARAWILEAHKLARLNGIYLPGTIMSEASCCYNPLNTPESFWKAQKNLPSLGRKEPPRGPRGSRLFVHMIPRRLAELLGEPDTDIMYRLFLRVCFRGDRVGLQHEPGYTGKCPWCDFQFPEDPRLPPPLPRFSSDKGKQQKMDEEYMTAITTKEQKETAALEQQGVTVTKESFNDLLQSVNQRYIVPPIVPSTISFGMDNLRGLLTLDPPPFSGFQTIIAETIDKVASLPPNAEKAQMAIAYGSLSRKAEEFQEFIQAMLKKPERYEPFAELLSLSPQSLGETLRSYFLLPLQRSLTSKGTDTFTRLQTKSTYKEMREATGFTAKEKGGLKRRQTTYDELGRETIDDIELFLNAHLDHLKKITTMVADDAYLKAKVMEVVAKLSVVVPLFIKVLRANILPAGSLGMAYLQNAMLSGIFAEFLDPDHLAEEYVGTVMMPERAITSKAAAPTMVFLLCLQKVRTEGLNLTTEQIRVIIADRNEKEKSKIIKDFDKLDKDGKKLELLKKSLGIGRWAKGGTKVIWQYDEAQYAFDKMERKEAGMLDFPTGATADDYMGDGGYDVIQTREDDA